MAELTLGVIAEDDNDCEVIRVLVRRIFEARGVRPGTWRLERRCDQGCSRLKRKAERWLVDLALRGCTAAVVVHDLDRNPHNGDLNDEAALRRELAAIPVPAGLRRMVCIPWRRSRRGSSQVRRRLPRPVGSRRSPILRPT